MSRGVGDFSSTTSFFTTPRDRAIRCNALSYEIEVVSSVWWTGTGRFSLLSLTQAPLAGLFLDGSTDGMQKENALYFPNHADEKETWTAAGYAGEVPMWLVGFALWSHIGPQPEIARTRAERNSWLHQPTPKSSSNRLIFSPLFLWI